MHSIRFARYNATQIRKLFGVFNAFISNGNGVLLLVRADTDGGNYRINTSRHSSELVSIGNYVTGVNENELSSNLRSFQASLR